MPTKEKISTVKKVLEGKSSIASIARELGIARKTIYSWLKIYKSAARRNKKTCLTPKYIKGRAHPREYKHTLEQKIVRLIKKEPTLSVSEMAEKLNAGHHAVYDLLKALNLNTEDSRLAYCGIYSYPGIFDPEIKQSAAKKVLSSEGKVSDVSRDLRVSRKTIYKWLKEYKENGAVRNNYLKGFDHPRALGREVEAIVLSEVAKAPELSIHALARSLNYSNHAVFNILQRNFLTHKNARINYSQAQIAQVSEEPQTIGPIDRIKSVFETFTPNLAPAPPPKFPLVVKTFLISSAFTFIIVSGSLLWASVIFGGGSFTAGIGLTLAMIALAAGTFFFLYSLKYYLTTAILLSFSNREKKKLDTENPGMNADLDNIHIGKYPFVSVHIPFYNEKNVVERSIKAATSFDYPAYEVILCDDSTDETTKKIRAFQESCLFKGEKLKETKGDGWLLTEVEVKPGVILKHLHRSTRVGYKGGALCLALKLSDPKTEFVSIFDADFVPYSDSLNLFVKYFKIANPLSEDYNQGKVAAVQGYQWHVLNKSENWITRGVRSEYAGSYVVERSGAEIYKGLKQISGSVYMIRKDVLSQIGWGTSITEDFELTLKLYDAGYKVLYTPYIQAPAECVSTIRRIVRQRMRWAEGHSFNVKLMAWKLLRNPKLSITEKSEFVYLMPYYLQAFFFLVGTMCWLISESVFKVRLPFWTELWGWSLILTNVVSLPLMNSVGMFLEESGSKDYLGLISFVALSYMIVPFQAYAAVKGFLEKEEGPWFRTPKTGHITDSYIKSTFYRFIQGIMPGKAEAHENSAAAYLALSSANNRFDNFNIKRGEGRRWQGRSFLAVLLIFANILLTLAPYVPTFVNPPAVQAETFGNLADKNAGNATANTSVAAQNAAPKAVEKKDANALIPPKPAKVTKTIDIGAILKKCVLYIKGIFEGLIGRIRLSINLIKTKVAKFVPVEKRNEIKNKNLGSISKNLPFETVKVTTANIQDLTKDESSNYAYKYQSGQTSISLGKKSDSGVNVQVLSEASGKPLEFKLKDQPVGGGKVSGDTLVYEVNLNNIPAQVKYTVSDNKVKEEFIINQKPEDLVLNKLGDKLRINFDLSANGLEIKNNQDGSYTLADSVSGEEVYQLSKITVSDVNGVSQDGSLIIRNTTAFIEIDSQFLKTAQYPVVIDPTVVIVTSSVTTATAPSTMENILVVNGTIHAFIQVGTRTATCGGSSKSGLLWFTSTDGSTWTCQAQVSSDTTRNFFASVISDTDYNIYIVYSVATTGANANYHIYFNKILYSGGTWTLGGSPQTVQSGSASVGNSYAVIELENSASPKLWLAYRSYNTTGTLYQVNVLNSDTIPSDKSSWTPTWSTSASPLDTAGTTSTVHIPVIVRFGTRIGVIYNEQVTAGYIKWRFREDGDSSTAWSQETTIIALTTTTPTFSALGDFRGKIHLAVNRTTGLYYSNFNGHVWSAYTTVSITAISGGFVGLSSDGPDVWIAYGDTTPSTGALSTNLAGSRRLVYKMGVPPFGAGDFDVTPTQITDNHGVFDKVWTLDASATRYTDVTTASQNSTTADVKDGTSNCMVQDTTSGGDAVFFGKSVAYDAVSWWLGTAGTGTPSITWQYCSGVDGSGVCNAWSNMGAAIIVSSTPNFTAVNSGYIAFDVTAFSNTWVTSKVNTDSSSYYYVRGLVAANFTVCPVGNQMTSMPVVNWASLTPSPVSGTIYSMWSENGASPIRVRTASILVSTSTPNTAAAAEIDPTVIGYSSLTTALAYSAQNKFVRTPDGSMHTFVQSGTTLACGESTSQNNNNGLMWIYSTDSGSTWVCGGQLDPNSTSNLMYASGVSDADGNIYVVYAYNSTGANNAYDVFYRKLTKSGSTWTLGEARTVLNGVTGSSGYSYATIELEDSTSPKLWMAARYFDNTNYQVSVYSSNGISDNPTWTVSQATFDVKGTTNSAHIPNLVRFGGNKIGCLFTDQTPGAGYLNWRFRDDSDGDTSWSTEDLVYNQAPTQGSVSVVGDANGRVYAAFARSAGVYFTYYNGQNWLPQITVSAAGAGGFTSIATGGTNVWVFYGQTTGLHTNLSGNRDLVYKKGVPPFNTNNFDTNATNVISRYGDFNEVYLYNSISATYEDKHEPAGEATTGDVSHSASGAIVKNLDDAIYFGKAEKFDSIDWSLSGNASTDGGLIWEYWSSDSSSWVRVNTAMASTNTIFQGNGYLSFIPNTDWGTTTVSGVSDYYIRARVIAAYTTGAVGTQFNNIMQINWAYFIPNPVNGTVYGAWTENALNPTRVRYISVALSTVIPNTASADRIPPTIIGHSSLTTGTASSTQHQFALTSDGTLHAFVQSGIVLTCGNDRGSSNNHGLVWVYSTDGGSSWICGGAIQSANYSANYMYASAVTDSSDNIYVTYGVSTTGSAAAYGVFYRKLTKGTGSTWTIETEQTIVAGSTTTGYSYPIIEIQDTGSPRLWVAVRYFDNTNYRVSVYYSTDLTYNTGWTISQSGLETAGTTNTRHMPAIVRFGTNIGVIYTDNANGDLYWRTRADTDGLTTWNAEALVTSSPALTTATFSAISDSSGNIYVAANSTTNIFFTTYSGASWSTTVTVSAAATSGLFVSIDFDGTNVWIIYPETTGINAAVGRNFVYKKGSFQSPNWVFDASSTKLVSRYTTFDKVWEYDATGSPLYSEVTGAAASSGTTSDVKHPTSGRMVKDVDDAIYFGMPQKFDYIGWDNQTQGSADGNLVWEYWNGSDWVILNTYITRIGTTFDADGYIGFMPNTDWQKTTIPGDTTSDYYVRGRCITAYTTGPIANQMEAFSQVSWASAINTTKGLYVIWTENAVSNTRIRFTNIPFVASTGSSFQRKTWWDGYRYWKSFYTGSEIQFWYSDDSGVTWYQDTAATITSASSDFSIKADPNVAFVVYTVSNDIRARQATSYQGTNFSWGSEVTVFDGSGSTDDYSYPIIARDYSNYIWVAARYTGSNVYYMKTIRATTAANTLPDGTETAYTVSDPTNSNSNVYGNITPLVSQDVYITFTVNTTLSGCKWVDGSSAWQNTAGSSCTNGANTDVIATVTSGLQNNMSATAGDTTTGNIHLVYIDSNGHATYQEYTSAVWQTAVTLDGDSGSSYITITYNFADDSVYALWIRGDTVYYNSAASPYTSGSWGGTPATWHTGTNLKDLSSNYSGTGTSQIFAEWTSGSGIPYTVEWDVLPIPENLLLLFMAGPVLPFLLKRRRRRKAAIVCRV